MLSLPPSVRLFMATQPVDGRKGADSLMAMVREVFAHGDDWLLVEATVPSTRELRRWLFGFAPYIEVIDPPQLREELRDAAHTLLERHGDASLASPPERSR